MLNVRIRECVIHSLVGTYPAPLKLEVCAIQRSDFSTSWHTRMHFLANATASLMEAIDLLAFNTIQS